MKKFPKYRNREGLFISVKQENVYLNFSKSALNLKLKLSTNRNILQYCNKLYIGETGRRLGDRFREHLRDVEWNGEDASKHFSRHFKLPNHSKKHMAVCDLSLHLGNSQSCKTLEQKFIFQIGTLNPHGINERFSFN